jgi:hypothetical protein
VQGRLEAFFEPGVLRQARFRSVPMIENPPFLGAAAALGIPQTIDFTAMSGITFVDTVAVSEARPPEEPLSLIFHELVHVVQYEVLGVAEFMRQYVLGFAAAGFSYDGIPLERMAFDLQGRFAVQPPEMAFSVRREVLAQLASGPGT